MRRQTAQAGAPRQKVAPEGAVLREILAGDPFPGAFVFHFRQSRSGPSLVTPRTELRRCRREYGSNRGMRIAVPDVVVVV
jgi:hypothetical protein